VLSSGIDNVNIPRTEAVKRISGSENAPPTKKSLISIYNFLSRKAIPGGAAILTVTSFASYAMGLFRDRLFARSFGAGPELDAYNASFIIPDLLLNIFVAGALAAAFIPVFSSLIGEKNKKQAHELANSVINSALLIMIFSGIAVFVLAPALSHVVAPGFSDASRSTLVNLMRLMVVSPIIFAISNSLGGMLVGYRRFLFYGLSPILYNLGIIIGTFFLAEKIGIYGVALGTIAGAILHLAIRVLGMKGVDFRYVKKISFTGDFKTVIRLMIPKMFGHPVELVTFWGFTAIASTLGPGNITVLNFARNFQSVPVSLFGIAFATAILPALSQLAAKKDFKEYKVQFFRALKGILALTIFSALFIFFTKVFIIRLFLGGGAFSEPDILLTASVLGIFTLSIPLESTNHLLARSFYALKNTVIPVTVSILALGIAVSFGYVLAGYIGILALPLAFSIGSLFKMTTLFILLHLRIKLFQVDT